MSAYTLEEHMQRRNRLNRETVRRVIVERGVNLGALAAMDNYWRWQEACALAHFRNWSNRR